MSVLSVNGPSASASVRCYARLALAGFHRAAAYWKASVAGLISNTTFALIRAEILLVAVAPSGSIAGYDEGRIVAYAWVSQGLYSVVLLWGDGELSKKVRTGDVAIDVSRPWNLQGALLAIDLGRAAFAVITRLAPPIAIGALFFSFRFPERTAAWALFAVSAVLAVVISFTLRFILELTTFWLMDVKGVTQLYSVVAGTLSGLTIPLAFFPHWAQEILWLTPFPAVLQFPVDIFIERGEAGEILLQQAIWAAGLTLLAQFLYGRAQRKLVIQGG
ncbi:ABC-2 family transporter protein [Streptomyces anulatus]|uniref:ABC transporter permease n=1 Tax=Streptomyces anulatus TaxID=1892 RepID=UPI003430BAAB